MSVNKHKVFISYYHHKDQFHKNYLIDVLNPTHDLFDDYSVNQDEIDETGKSDETIRRIIRDDYIADATVLILLCGVETKYRKFVDWELHAAMYDTELNPKMGIIVINLPTISQSRRGPTDIEKPLVSPGSTNWTSLNTRSEYESHYPYMPSRIIDCLEKKKSEIAVTDWSIIESNPHILKELVDISFRRRKNVQYDTSSPLRRRNS
jgi:hypothetical protein